MKLPQYGMPIAIQGGSLNRLVRKCIGPTIVHMIEPPYRKDKLNPTELDTTYERYNLMFILETGTWVYRFKGTTTYHIDSEGKVSSKVRK